MEQYWLAVFIPLLLLWFCWSTVSLDRRLRTVEHNLAALLRHFNVDPLALAPPSERVKQLAADPARKIEAIRAYRQETGADLRAAQAVIDSLAARG